MQRSEAAVASIFAAKGRPQFNPLIVHVENSAQAEKIGVFDARARELARCFWPGALTLVVARRKDCGISWLASAGLETIALRCPAGVIAQRLLSAFGGPIAAPSANRSGAITSTTAQHVAESFGMSIELILDGGQTQLGLEFDHRRIDRAAADAAQTRRDRARGNRGGDRCARRGFGQQIMRRIHRAGLKSHYAPVKPLRLERDERGSARGACWHSESRWSAPVAFSI